MAIDRRDNSRYKTFTRRALILGGAQTAAFAVLGGRMYYLQIMKTDEYRMLAEENRVNVRLLAPLRGRIVDRFGTVLASNRQNYRAVMVSEQTPDVEDTLHKLARIVEITPDARKKIMRDIARAPRFMPVVVAENLTWEQFAQVNINEPDLPGIQPDVGETRHYPFSTELAHVVGYVTPVYQRDLDKDPDEPLLKLPGFRIGKSGVEQKYDEPLRGIAGASHVEVNAYGRVIRELSKDTGKPGAEVVLTLDMEVQQFACERLKDESASAVVMDIHTGEVISFVSTPAFDPNQFNIGYGAAAYKALLDNPYLPLTNKALAGLYPPGSTFKTVTALAALQAGIDPNKTVHCNGKYAFGNHLFHCWKKEGHGNMNMHDGIKHSCDVYFYDVARRIGIDAIEKVAKDFGLGQTYDFDISGEKQGIVPSRAWKRAVTGESWQQGETLISGIGQGFLLTTPLQLAVLASRIANGGYAVTPRLTRAIGGTLLPVPPAPKIDVDPEWVKIVQGGMNGVSNEPGGTAYRSRITEVGMELAGKTGSAQVRRISMAERQGGVRKNDALEWRLRDHALFICFAPVANPQYAMSLVIEHGGSGSGAAAPAARDIMLKALTRSAARQQASLPHGHAGHKHDEEEG
ncbi:MAG: penicillin-binding protein 2 [Parvibaculum sp.]|uniref:penicillin-binding protein 2 n=1 Tax=Parvibaculum sp. TaxID=2024848 RepID=UPI0025F36932|nr:penicillin-binding protein 2 [Parvibaculum sp.]MCE9650796.1 penicillin-binding protein 2 [Parvibaculum sp.]